VKELIELFEARKRAPEVPHAVATVLRVEGSSYRRPGARMLVDVHGRVGGSVSGGCLERNVISEAKAVLLDGRARLLAFDTTDQDDLAFGTSLGCLGKIWIGIEVLPANRPWPFEKLVGEIRQQRRPAALLTRIFDNEAGIRFESTALFASPTANSPDFSEMLCGEIEDVFRQKKSRFVGKKMHGSTLIEWLEPPVALILFGAGPDVPPLVKLARNLGHEITVIDRRPDFALPEQFPQADRVLAAQPHQVSALLRPDARTVAVVMNHHYDTDRDVLRALVSLNLSYVAILGPRRRTERILTELQDAGLFIPESVRATLHAPAGLDLGGESPEQIALAILAEIQASLAGREGGKLKFRASPIHAETGPPRKEAWASRV
jgi:xanthine dehydrogenase accessory factor